MVTETHRELNNYDVIELSPGVMVINWYWKNKQPSGGESLPSACHHSENTKFVVFVQFPLFHFLHKYLHSAASVLPDSIFTSPLH
jgi:hypothetical protein